MDSMPMDSGAMDSASVDSAASGSVEVPGSLVHAARARAPTSSSDVGFQDRTRVLLRDQCDRNGGHMRLYGSGGRSNHFCLRILEPVHLLAFARGGPDRAGTRLGVQTTDGGIHDLTEALGARDVGEM